MKLTALHIQQLPGIEPGFQLDDLDPEVNLLLGPNASGKSSVVRALRHLMEARNDDPPGLILSATFSDDAHQWQVERLGRDIHWRRDGTPCAPPPLPGADGLGFYWIGLDRLLELTREDRAVESALRREMQGGYDLQSLRDHPLLTLPPRRGQQAAREVLQGEQALRQLERAHQALAADEATLPAIREALTAARAARERQEACELALQALEAARALQEQEERLAAYPDPMPAGLTQARVDELERQLAEQGRALQRAREDRARAEAQWQGTGLAEGLPPTDELQTASSEARRLARLEEQVEQRRARLEAARQAAAEAARALGRDPGKDAKLPPLSPDRLAGLEERARKVHAADERVQALEARLEALGDAPDSDPPAPLEQGAHELRRWLRQPKPQPLQWLGLGLTALGGTGTTALGLTFGHWPTVASSLVVLAGLGASGVVLWRQRDRRDSQARYADLPLTPPEDWTETGVHQRLQALERAHHQARSREQRRHEADQLHAELTRARSDQSAARQALQADAAPLGLDASLPLSLERTAHLLARHQQAREELAREQAALTRQTQDMDELRVAVQTRLAHWDAAPRQLAGEQLTGEKLTAAVDALRERAQTAERARQGMDNADRLIQDRARQQRDTQEALEQLYRDAGLTPAQRPLLLERIDQLEAWQACRQARDEARSNYRLRRRDLEDRAGGDILEWLESGDEPALRRAADEAAERAARVEALQEERAAINSRLEQARRRHDLEEALARRDEARERLSEERDHALRASAGRFLLDRVARRHEQDHRPEALARADQLFGRFTHQRYGLRLSPSQALQAVDHRSDRPHPLDTLSTGTRMQLLIALRVAWLEQLERQTRPLPLILDEALTTTDPERFQAVAGSLAALLETGRQVFYLSAQPEDAQRWEAALGRVPHCVDLATLRASGRALSEQRLQLPAQATVPDPAGHTAESYAQTLQVPGVNPWQHAGEIHLFHLLRDQLDTLHRLLRDFRIRYAGELERLLADPALREQLPEPLHQQLHCRLQLARHWLHAWRRGRGRPVTRGVLEASGAVSETFIARVAEINDAHGGDARALLEALRNGEASGFRKAKIDELEAYLQSEGHLDPQPRLDSAERYRAALAKVELPLEAVGRDARVIDWLEAALLA